MVFSAPSRSRRSPPPLAAPSLVLRHMPSLDSIRGAAILMVLLFHGFGSYGWVAAFGGFWGALASRLIAGGRFGVNVFFVLSGFLITTLLFKARERPDFYRNFYIRRVLRILPVYLLVLAIVWACGIISNRFLLAALLFLANFSQLFGAPMRQFGALWSLAVEEHFTCYGLPVCGVCANAPCSAFSVRSFSGSRSCACSPFICSPISTSTTRRPSCWTT